VEREKGQARKMLILEDISIEENSNGNLSTTQSIWEKTLERFSSKLSFS